MATVNSADFFEEDEPVAKVRRDFERGAQGVTGRPERGQTQYLALPGLGMAPASSNRTFRELANS